MGRRWLTISLSLLVMLALAAGARYIIVVDDEDLEESDLERIKRIALGTEEIAGRFVFRDAPAPDLGFVLALPCTHISCWTIPAPLWRFSTIR